MNKNTPIVGLMFMAWVEAREIGSVRAGRDELCLYCLMYGAQSIPEATSRPLIPMSDSPHITNMIESDGLFG